jgi:hypothetical protein
LILKLAGQVFVPVHTQELVPLTVPVMEDLVLVLLPVLCIRAVPAFARVPKLVHQTALRELVAVVVHRVTALHLAIHVSIPVLRLSAMVRALALILNRQAGIQTELYVMTVFLVQILTLVPVVHARV